MSSSFVFGVDLDGVCGDYTAAFAAVVAEERNVDPSSLPAQRGWDFSEWQLEDLGGFDAVHRAAVMDHRMFRTMPVMPGAAMVSEKRCGPGVGVMRGCAPVAITRAPVGEGGGWGEPHARDPDAVARDVLDELITISDAAALYAVVIDPATREVNRAATAELRLARTREGWQ